ncbi:hypothetical protein GY45DRAFT_1324067 [Cubamyces sp. BRFM 1775]|nr:hypothetical protein GY45DRAFT_1324067 [Cubamyces sp. BRFM 1775]
MVQSLVKISRTKSAMDIDPSTHQAVAQSLALSPPIYHHATYAISVAEEREPTPFPFDSSSDRVDSLPSPYHRPLSPVSLPDEDYMATSQSSHASTMTIEDMDSEELAGTRESTPVADVPQSQGIHRMESIVALGPVDSAAPGASTSPQAPPQQPRPEWEAVLQHYLMMAQEMQARHFDALAELTRSIQVGMVSLTAELRALREEAQKVGDARARAHTPKRVVVQRIRVPRYPS